MIYWSDEICIYGEIDWNWDLIPLHPNEYYYTDCVDKHFWFSKDNPDFITESWKTLRESQFVNINYDYICDRSRSRVEVMKIIIETYYQEEDCEVFDDNFCLIVPTCQEIAESRLSLPDKTILSHLDNQIMCDYYKNIYERARCEYLLDTRVNQSLEQAPTQLVVPTNTSMQVLETQQTTTIAQANLEPQPILVPQNKIITLSINIKVKIEKVKEVLDKSWYKWDIVVPLVKKIKENQIVWSKKYLIADYLISLY